MIPKYVTYILQNEQNIDLFIYWCKFTDVLTLSDLVKNPAFDIEQTYNLYIMGYYDTWIDASNAQHKLIMERGQPILLMSHLHNKLGMIKCNETGQVWWRQSDCVRELGCDSSALSRHLKRQPGFATVKGLTFSRAQYIGMDNKPETLTPAQMYKPMPRNKWIKCDTTGISYRTQREACKANNINQGQLSQHLQKHAGYKKVKGLTFSYIQGDKPYTINPVQYPIPSN